MAGVRLGWLLLLLAPAALVAQSPTPPTPPGIQDNSFLIEEAYNQERGVVQHISVFARQRNGDWGYSFTQEWPFRGLKHQLSYSVPIVHSGNSTGLGDVFLNFRWQLLGGEGAQVWVAPRISAILPTGRWQAGRGDGVVGVQLALPVSIELAPRLAGHLNAGITFHSSARAPSGDRATLTSLNAGASLIFLATPAFNVLLESVVQNEAAVAGPGVAARETTVLLSPGIRWAFNFPSGLQIVPGAAYSFTLGKAKDQTAILFYLSFEHSFARH